MCCQFLQQNLIIRMYFLPIWNNFSERNCFDKAFFNNVSRLNHYSPLTIILEILTRNKPYLHETFMPFYAIFLVCPFPCLRTHFKEVPRYKNDKWWFSSVTFHWIKHYQYQSKVFWGGKKICCGNNYTSLSLKKMVFSPSWGMKGKNLFIFLF